VRIFKTKEFNHFTNRENITAQTLKKAALKIESGLIDADLGGGVIKQRVPRPGKGKSGGYRVIVCFQKERCLFFVHGFAKSRQSNISATELIDLRDLAKILLNLSDEQLTNAIAAGAVLEILEGTNGEKL
jgi:hypothetical protein